MTKLFVKGIAALLTVIVAAALAAPGALAQAKKPEKHDSNTLHKVGKAIQYPVRKAGENLSTNVHRAAGKNSVRHDRNTGKNVVVKPSGKTVTIRRSSRYAHRRHVRRHVRHHIRHHRHHRYVRHHRRTR